MYEYRLPAPVLIVCSGYESTLRRCILPLLLPRRALALRKVAAALALQGEVLEAKGDIDAAIASYQAAVDIEDQNNYTEPPDWPQPIRHYLGAALLQAGRAEEAEKVYLRDLRWNQNNGWSLYGLHQALLAQGKNADAERVKAQYESAWRYAEMDLTRSRL